MFLLNRFVLPINIKLKNHHIPKNKNPLNLNLTFCILNKKISINAMATRLNTFNLNPLTSTSPKISNEEVKNIRVIKKYITFFMDWNYTLVFATTHFH
jgi:hypothetical protein